MRRLGLGLLLASTSWSCQGLRFSEEEAPLDPRAPYQLSILETTACPLPPGLDPARVRIVGVKVRLRGNHEKNVPANYFYASVLTSDQSRYLAEHSGCSPVLTGAPLAPGEIAEGYLNFPVPSGKIPEVLAYSPALSGLSEAASAVELSLGKTSAAREEIEAE